MRLWHLRPFRNIIRRMDNLLQELEIVPILLLEENVLDWQPGSITEQGSLGIGTRSDQLLVLGLPGTSAPHEKAIDNLVVQYTELDELDELDNLTFVMAIDIRLRRRGRAGFQPSSIGPTILFDQKGLVGTPAYLLSAKMRLFVPVKSLGLVSIRTFPYAQQDTEHHRCIDVSLWMGLEYLSRRRQARRLPLRGLRKAGGIRTVDHLGGVPGLYADEILQVIEGANLTAAQYVNMREQGQLPRVHSRFIQSHTTTNARGIAYLLFLEALHSYLDSQFPIFLIIARFPLDTTAPKDGRRDRAKQPTPHSVCVMGHIAYDTKTAPDLQAIRTFKKHVGFLTTTAYLRELVVQDDDVGPLLRLPVWRRDEVKGSREDTARRVLWDESLQGNAIAFSVGLPRDIRLAYESAFARVSELIALLSYNGAGKRSAFRAGYDKALTKFGVDLSPSGFAGLFLGALDTQQLVVGFYLEHTRRLQQHIQDMPSGAARAWLLNRNLPRFVWIAEIAIREWVEDGDEAFVVGEVYIDATQSASLWSLLAYRLPGVLATLERRSTYVFANWPARKSWVRSNFEG